MHDVRLNLNRCKEFNKFYVNNERFPSQAASRYEANLYMWGVYLRKAYREGRVPRETAQKISEEYPHMIRFMLASKVRTWDENYANYIAYIHKYMKIPRTKTKPTEEAKLSVWMNHNRFLYNNDRLTKYKIDKLTEISPWLLEDKVPVLVVDYSILSFYIRSLCIKESILEYVALNSPEITEKDMQDLVYLSENGIITVDDLITAFKSELINNSYEDTIIKLRLKNINISRSMISKVSNNKICLADLEVYCKANNIKQELIGLFSIDFNIDIHSNIMYAFYIFKNSKRRNGEYLNTLFYKIYGDTINSMSNTADKFNVSRQRILQIENSIFETLQALRYQQLINKGITFPYLKTDGNEKVVITVIKAISRENSKYEIETIERMILNNVDDSWVRNKLMVG